MYFLVILLGAFDDSVESLLEGFSFLLIQDGLVHQFSVAEHVARIGDSTTVFFDHAISHGQVRVVVFLQFVDHRPVDSWMIFFHKLLVQVELGVLLLNDTQFHLLLRDV